LVPKSISTPTDRQTDGRTTTYSERERELTFAKNYDYYYN